MIYDFSFPVRYHALVLCLLPITVDDRSKELSLSSSTYNRDRAIECLKRAGIDNYKVSRTCHFSSSVLFEVKMRGEKKEKVLLS